MKKPHPLAKKKPTHFKVRHTGMIITEATRARWERQQLARSLQEFPDLPKGPKRPRLNSRRKRKERNLLSAALRLGLIELGDDCLSVRVLGEDEPEAPPPVLGRRFVNKKRRARSKKYRQARIDRVVQERKVQAEATKRAWFRIRRP